MEKDISIKLYQAITDSNERRVFEHWHASSLAECPRAQYFKRLGVEPLSTVTAAKVLRWKAGHLMEEAIRPIIAKVYGETSSNKRYISKKLDMTGEFDNLVLAGNKLVEIKTVHDMAFIEKDGIVGLKENLGKKTFSTGREVNTWGVKQTPYLNHEIQNHGYVMLLEEEGIKVEGIDYVYISLGGRIVVYTTQVQPELLQNVTTRLNLLNEAWRTKTPPPCICMETTHPLYENTMKWCEFRDEANNTCCEIKLSEGVK